MIERHLVAFFTASDQEDESDLLFDFWSHHKSAVPLPNIMNLCHIEIHQNNQFSYFVDISVSISNLRQKKKLVPETETSTK